jgi:hypothetical protein
MRVVKTRLMDIEKRHRDTSTSSGTAVRRFDIGLSGFLKKVWYPYLGELGSIKYSPSLKHAENIGWCKDLPGWKGQELLESPSRTHGAR